MLKAELEERVQELETEVGDLKSKLADEELNGEAIEECRRMFADIGLRSAFFDDIVAAACQEIKALRYDRRRFVEMKSRMWSMKLDTRTTKEMPKRPKGWTDEVLADVALAE